MAQAGPHMLDDQTIVACTILSAAVDRLVGRSSLVSSAIRTAISTRQETALRLACRAFNALDPKLRRRIADTAEGGAFSLRVRLPRFLLAPHESSVPRTEAPPPPKALAPARVAPIHDPWARPARPQR